MILAKSLLIEPIIYGARKGRTNKKVINRRGQINRFKAEFSSSATLAIIMKSGGEQYDRENIDFGMASGINSNANKNQISINFSKSSAKSSLILDMAFISKAVLGSKPINNNAI